MGRRAKNQQNPVLPVSSKKQLLRIEGVCAFLSVSRDTLDRLRGDTAERFPTPLQMLATTPLWSVEQLEKYVARKEQEAEALSA